MNPITKDVRVALDTFAAAWTEGDQSALSSLFTESSVLHSSAHGQARGAAEIASLFSADLVAKTSLRVVTTNHSVSGDDRRTVLTSYLYGVSSPSDPTPSTFGATLLADLVRTEDGWQFAELRLSIPWTDGDPARFVPWSLPSAEGWKLGDATPAIVSELDSPWSRGVPDLDADDAVQQAADFYARYAWAIDQGDIALLRDCFTEDVSGSFPPMGDLDGRHEVIGQMKSFRRGWPWMQHFGRTLHVTVDEAQTSAHLVVGRIIPQQSAAPNGQDLYGAHYQLDLRRQNGIWRISSFDYIPGWITTKEP
ncbi:nuclear transport factor 2 family protein [Streptomyces sp. NPDC002088]|uniref:nuclear transport factor 2 family protein n=1 Tax=Streptomyces sp. NPDC002088 TaxID=3154665 RepID=UPI00332CFDDC